MSLWASRQWKSYRPTVNKKCGRWVYPTRYAPTGLSWYRYSITPRRLRLITLTFDLGGHGACGWCGSSSSICIPSLMFVGLAIRKIWCTMCVNINGPGDLDFWPFDLETGMRVASKVGNLPSKFGHARPLGSGIIRYVRNGRTDRDGRTDKSNAYCPLPYRGGA